MPITPQILEQIAVELRTSFNTGLAGASKADDYLTYSTLVKSSSAANTYPDFSAVPSFKEWIGDKDITTLSASAYTLVNKAYSTGALSIKRADIEDGNIGLLPAIMEGYAREARNFMNKLAKEALGAGDVSLCADGTPYFGTEHKGKGKAKQSNIITGTGDKWYLFDTEKPIKSIIAQIRQAPALYSQLEGSEAAFMSGDYRYSVDARGVAGYGFWATALQSQEELTVESFYDAVKLMDSYVNSEGSKLGINPTVIAVPKSLEYVANQLFNAPINAGGGTNVMAGRVKVLVLG